MLTEIIQRYDQRYSQFNPALKKEIVGLSLKRTWIIVKKTEVPPNANILEGRFALGMKDAETPGKIREARFVVHGHKDDMKSFLVHSVSVAKYSA